MLYVVNKYRNLTQDVASALEVMNEIQIKSKLTVTGIVNNSHLRDLTDAETIENALEFGWQCAQDAGVSFACTTAPESILAQKNPVLCQVEDKARFYSVQKLVKTPWE